MKLNKIMFQNTYIFNFNKYNKLQNGEIKMSDLNKDFKIVLLVVAGFLLTGFLIFVGFNVNFKPIELKSETPSQISIEKAEATKVQARVYGYVQNSEINNLNGKFIKVSVLNSKNEDVGTKFLKIENLEKNERKLFKAMFNVKEVKSYSIDIVDSENQKIPFSVKVIEWYFYALI